MWEQCVLNEINGQLQMRDINYWRDKRGHEIDFIVNNRSDNALTAIECKFNCAPDELMATGIGSIGKNFKAFRENYPDGDNFIVSSNINPSFSRKHKELTITFINTKDLINKLKPSHT